MDVGHRHGITSATFFKSKGKSGGRDVSQAGRLKLLTETAALKKLLADAMTTILSGRTTPSTTGHLPSTPNSAIQ